MLFGAISAGAAVDVIAMAGLDTIEKAVLERAGQFDDILADAGAEVLAPWRHPGERAGIISFRLPGEDTTVTAERLRRAGLVFSERGAWLRIAAHASTSAETLEMFRDAL